MKVWRLVEERGMGWGAEAVSVHVERMLRRVVVRAVEHLLRLLLMLLHGRNMLLLLLLSVRRTVAMSDEVMAGEGKTGLRRLGGGRGAGRWSGADGRARSKRC